MTDETRARPGKRGTGDAQPLWQAPLPLGELQTQLDEGDGLSTLAQPGDWGYFLRVSPELGYFSWFRSRAEMLRYLVQVEILHAPTSLPDRERYDALVQELMAVASRFEQDEDGDGACAAFNASFPDFRLEWLGSFQSLIDDPHPFAAALRAAYGEDLTDRAGFAAFLEQYGL